MFPISSKVTFSVLFLLFKAEITVSKLTLHLMGEMFNIRVGKITVWNLAGYIFENFYFILPFENFGMHLRFLCSGRFITCALRWDRVYCLSICVDISRITRVAVIGNEIGRLVKFVDLCRKWINILKTWHILRRHIAAASLKIWCENFNPVKS